MKLRRHIALVGLPGAGKTSVGRSLAARLACAFVDSDAEVEATAGMSAPNIFARHGEATFRTLEREAIERLIQSEPKVLALGGGAFQNSAIRETLLQRALTIWLVVPEDVLVQRLRREGGRPLLSGPDLRARLRSLSEDRLASYSQAHVRVAAVSSAEMTDKILSLLTQSDIAAVRASR